LRANDISLRISDVHEEHVNLEVQVMHYTKMAKHSGIDFVARAQATETIAQLRVQQADLMRLVLKVCQSCRPLGRRA